jgi:hypothetical protein
LNHQFGHQNLQKKIPNGDTFPIFFETSSTKNNILSVVVRRLSLFCFLCGFLEGLTLDLFALAQSKHSFPFSAWPLKEHRFYNIYCSIYGTFGVRILKKNTSKPNLKTSVAKMNVLLLPGPIESQSSRNRVAIESPKETQMSDEK